VSTGRALRALARRYDDPRDPSGPIRGEDRIDSNVLLVGAGDIAQRVVPLLVRRSRVWAVTRRASQAAALARLGAVPVTADLDDFQSLAPLAGLADSIVHLAPPPSHGPADTRTRNLIALLERSMVAHGAARPAVPRGPLRLLYVSTSGVYGDCAGEEVDESRPLHPATERAQRRADAEAELRAWEARSGAAVVVLRVPGIYAADRLPLERLHARTPVLRAEEDVYTNHIHADDLAAIVTRALEGATPGACYNASDDTVMKMGEYFDLVADTFGLARPPRVSRADAAALLPPVLRSFMSESRRLVNRRMKSELGVSLRYPTVRDGLRAAAGAAGAVKSGGGG
jgi:nucleoside-diphosphate-sugar epimerase